MLKEKFINTFLFLVFSAILSVPLFSFKLIRLSYPGRVLSYKVRNYGDALKVRSISSASRLLEVKVPPNRVSYFETVAAVRNLSNSSKKYKVEPIYDPRKIKIKATFSNNGLGEIWLSPGEESYVNLQVASLWKDPLIEKVFLNVVSY